MRGVSRACRSGAAVLLTALTLNVLTLAACSSSSSGSHPTTGAPLGWAPGAAEAANGTVGPLDVATVCGSSTDQFLEELLHHSIGDLKVMKEWGGVTPAGRQVLAAGTVATVHQGPGDLPMDHPFGDDLSMDIDLTDAFKPLSQKLGSAPSDTEPGQLHVEISSGLIPHLPQSTPAPSGQTWRQLSDIALAGFQPGFDHPAIGDPVLVGGRFIIDCGHPDYHTEIHPISFIAWSHQQGTSTTVHVYANGYWDTELFNPDLSVLGQVGSTTRLSDPNTKPLPTYLVDEVLRLISAKTPQLRTFELIGAMTPPNTSWAVCAPPGTTGKRVTVDYDLRTRPGVAVTVTPDDATGCASIAATFSASLSSPPVAMRSCVMPWAYVNSIAGAALSTPVDARAIITANVPAQDRALVDRDPLTGCSDPLAAPPVAPSPTTRSVTTDGSQPFPLYGIITVSRS